jgi:hypothetical protein
MSAAADVMAIIMFVFFLAGVGTGFILVVALSARRADRAGRRDRRAALASRTWPYRDPVRPD